MANNRAPWAPTSTEEFAQCTEQGWVVYGWQPLGENTPVIWSPYVWEETYWNSTGDAEAWARILEQALCGDPLAIKAMRDIVESNPEYYEYQATLEAISASAN